MANQDEGQIKDFICKRLGSGTVAVELTDEQLDVAIDDAKRWWQTWVGQIKAVALQVGEDAQEIPAAAIASDLDAVVEVVFQAPTDRWWDAFKWADVEYNPFSNLIRGIGQVSQIEQYLQYREMSQRIVSADKDWHWDRAREMLVLIPKPDAGTKVLVYYMSKEVDVAKLTNYEFFLMRRYAQAQAMKTLAAIRMKFSDKPSATGAFTMDGDAMWANAEAIEAEVEEKAKQLQHPTGLWAD